MSSACDNNSTMVFMESNKTDITSSNWPNPYPDNSNCKWEIIAPLGSKIQLTLKRVHVDERYVSINPTCMVRLILRFYVVALKLAITFFIYFLCSTFLKLVTS